VGIGICIRDDHGKFVLARSDLITPITSVEVGEAIELLHALRWVDELQIHEMDFEVDCKMVVEIVFIATKTIHLILVLLLDTVEVY
jgi:hypothetical protein